VSDPGFYLTLSATTLVATAMIVFAVLDAWRGWLSLKAQQLRSGDERPLPAPTASARIEIADLKERIRKLEAIAAGVDL
jgi:hypothetical protein